MGPSFLGPTSQSPNGMNYHVIGSPSVTDDSGHAEESEDLVFQRRINAGHFRGRPLKWRVLQCGVFPDLVEFDILTSGADILWCPHVSQSVSEQG